jgi:hypothetical protein
VVLILLDHLAELSDGLSEPPRLRKDDANQVERQWAGLCALVQVFFQVVEGRIRVSQRVVQ